jgi:hypothetical protein
VISILNRGSLPLHTLKGVKMAKYHVIISGKVRYLKKDPEVCDMVKACAIDFLPYTTSYEFEFTAICGEKRGSLDMEFYQEPDTGIVRINVLSISFTSIYD